MKKILALLALLLASPALGADNGIQVTNGTGPLVRCKDVGAGVQACGSLLVDQTGAFIGAFSNFGTTPGAVPVPGVNAAIIGTVPVSGTITANQGTANATPWLVTGAGQTFPTTAAVGSYVNGWDATQGLTTDAACATDNGTCTLIALVKRNNQNVSAPASVNPGTPANWGIGVLGATPPANAVYIGGLGSADGFMHSVTLSGWGLVPTGFAVGVNAAIPDGADATQGAKADAVCGTATGTCSDIALTKFIATAVTGPIPTQAATVPIGGVGLLANATGGATPGSAIAPATPAGVSLKASAGTVYSVQLGNIQSTPVYLKLYDSASAPTCGSGTPVKRLIIPAASIAANGGGSNIAFPVGIKFTSGIGYCVTGALPDNDTTAITAANVLVNIDWN